MALALSYYFWIFSPWRNVARNELTQKLSECNREGIGTSSDKDLSYYETPIGKNAGYDISSFNVGNGIFCGEVMPTMVDD